MNGTIYFLKNPNTHEIFYIGATTIPLNKRLEQHYAHLKEYKNGLRNWNKRFEYLDKLYPVKAKIYSIELVDKNILDNVESMYIGLFKSWGFELTNSTDGGKGGNTYKYLNTIQKEKTKLKLKAKLTGKSKPIGFSENLSINRQGANNPMAKTGKYGPIVSFDKLWNPIKMFKYSYEITADFNNAHLHSNIIKMLTGKTKPYKPAGLNWKFFKDCNKQIQDIVQSIYENK